MTDYTATVSDQDRRAPQFSLIVPIHNETDVLPALLERLDHVVTSLDVTFEWLFVDDGSTDHSARLLTEASAHYPDIRVLRLSRNFGKEAAVSAGLNEALGEAAILMDADLQDPPELIPDMIHEWRNGADVVLMRRRSRAGESWFKRASASAFYRLLNRMSDADIPVDTGDFRLMNRKTINAIRQMPERNRYMKGLFSWVGMKTVTIDFDRDPRLAGDSKWGYWKLLRFAMDGVTSFSTRPLRMALLLGLLTAFVGGGFGVWEVTRALLFGIETPGYASMITVITLLSGVQLICIGILGEYIGRIYIETKQRPLYLIADDSSTPDKPTPIR